MLGNEQALDGADTVGTVKDGSEETPSGLRSIRGGWLADEVGMGKTVIAISVILANPLPQPHPVVAEFNRLAAAFTAWDRHRARKPNMKVHPNNKHEDPMRYPEEARVRAEERRYYERAMREYRRREEVYRREPQSRRIHIPAPHCPISSHYLRTAAVAHPRKGQETPEYSKWLSEQPPRGRKVHMKATLIIAPPTLAAQVRRE